jgi:hypothetical protein
MHAAMQQYGEWAKKKMDPLFVHVFRSNFCSSYISTLIYFPLICRAHASSSS